MKLQGCRRRVEQAIGGGGLLPAMGETEMRVPVKVMAGAAPVAVLLVFGLVPDLAQSTEPDIIVTAAPTYAPLAALRGEERFPSGAHLLLLHNGKAEPLAPGFAASADASVSFDAKTVLFSGKRSAGDPWQVWELTLADRSVRKVIEGAGDAIRPLYLPFDRVVYARRASNGFQLESAGTGKPAADPGAAPLRLSYLPGSAIPADVLQDGRILFEAGFPLGSGAAPELFLVYADGSGVESYRCDHGAARWGGRQLASGDVVFTHGAGLARFTSPLAAEAPIDAPRAEYSGAIAETASNAWLVSARTRDGAHFTLHSWKPGAAALQPVLAESGLDLVEPVVVAPRGRPKRHPSALHEWNYANLLALDARQSREGDLKTAPVSVRLETVDAGGRTVVAGEAAVEEDGSFFVKTPADRPIRFALLDQNGAVVRREQGWFWIRRGEQRICVGCHTGPDRASRNKVPDVLLRSTRPADLTRVDTAHTDTGGK